MRRQREMSALGKAVESSQSRGARAAYSAQQPVVI